MRKMDENTLQILKGGSEQDLMQTLQDFSTKNAQVFTFPDIKDELKEKLVDALLQRLQTASSSRCHCLCLQALRLFSREKNRLGTMVTENGLSHIMQLAGLEHYAQQGGDSITIQEGNPEVTIEAQKCLCNLIFNSTQAQSVCSHNGCVEGIIQRLKTYKDPDLPFDIKFFDMRMLFLLTALCTDTRPKIRFELHGFTYLMEVIDLTLRDEEGRGSGLTDQEIDLCSEILKILFNLTVTIDRNNIDEFSGQRWVIDVRAQSTTSEQEPKEEEAHFMRLVSVLRDLLVCKTISKDKKEELHSHTINLLINMPKDCYEELLIPLNEGDVGSVENKEVEFDGKNMEAIVILLNFLYRRLDRPTKSLKECLTPILHCLCETCRSNRAIRKFCKSKVLPPLKDEVKRLPEEGETLRNKLCKLLTSPIMEVKELTADLLFVLCKENVARMVKYTGYGNCAGLLANRGLMLGGQGGGDYSSDSQDSDTEEYTNLKDKINPVTGRYEEDKPDPLADMSEEQKEYEAMKLVNVIDKLHREGIIQASTIGADGRPTPISHVLELTDQAGADVPGTTHGSDSEPD